MNKKIFGAALLLILALSLANVAFAQGNPQNSDWGQELSGKVVEIQELSKAWIWKLLKPRL